eukprot:526313_1
MSEHTIKMGWFWLIFCTTLSSPLDTCCSYPVEAFILCEFAGPCACQTLQQKWRRFVDWVEMEGGYVHPWIEYNYAYAFADYDEYLNLYYHEKAIFSNIPIAGQSIQPGSLLMQIPLSISLSQPLISKYIKHAQPSSNPLISTLFAEPDFFMPDGFPDWNEFLSQTETNDFETVGWWALGMAWLKEYTHELLPWFELLPTSNYLPILWDDTEREQLLNGTQALRLFKHDLLRVMEDTRPYLDLLGLSEAQVRYALGMIGSRRYTMLLNGIDDDAIPPGIDFFNHKRNAQYTLHYDASFGYHKQIEGIVLRNRDVETVGDIDFASIFLVIDEVIHNASEIFVSYGRHCSAAQMAYYGFMDAENSGNYYTLPIELQREDRNFEVKQRYFDSVWSIKKIMTPPREMQYAGRRETVVRETFLRMVRLLYLRPEHFDSFTINAILNDFEYDYLENVIDPEFEKQMHRLCWDALKQFPTTQYMDMMLHRQVERQLDNIWDLMELNGNKNLTETERLKDMMSSMDRRSLVIQYRMRERELLNKCTRAQFIPAQKYLQRRKRNK